MRDLIRSAALSALVFLPVAVVGDHLQDGLDAYNVGDYEKSMEMCLPLAEQGVPAAQFCVGRLYANGFGVPMDDEQAHKWYGMAAAAGHAEAQFNLGVMYANGWGTPMNDTEAAKWYDLAAEHGNLQAQLALAAVLHAGRGIEQSIQDAYMWYCIAAELGDTAAISKCKDVSTELSAEDKAAADIRADAWLANYQAKQGQAGHAD